MYLFCIDLEDKFAIIFMFIVLYLMHLFLLVIFKSFTFNIGLQHFYSDVLWPVSTSSCFGFIELTR